MSNIGCLPQFQCLNNGKDSFVRGIGPNTARTGNYHHHHHHHNNNNNNLFSYSALFNMLGDQNRITTINNLKTINTSIRNIQIYLISKRY